MSAARRTRGRTARSATHVERGIVRAAEATIEYEIIRSPRRRKTLEIRLDGPLRVRVAVPLRTSRSQVVALVQQRSTWILRRAEELAACTPHAFAPGERLPYLGRMLTITVAPAATASGDVRMIGDQLLVPLCAADSPRAPIEHWYRRRAQRELAARVDAWSQVLGVEPRRVLIGNQRSRWGSCARDGTLRFTWRALLLPPDLVDYLVVHELAHLAVHNHSAAFWAEVGRALPDYEQHRCALRLAASTLDI